MYWKKIDIDSIKFEKLIENTLKLSLKILEVFIENTIKFCEIFNKI